MNVEYKRAEELFKQYRGSPLAMFRAGLIQEYKSYHCSTEMEGEWVQELIEEHSRSLSIRDWNALHELTLLAGTYKDERILKNAIAFASRHVMSSDSLVKLMYAEELIEIIASLQGTLTTEVLHESLVATKIILDDVISKPLVIDPGHELEHFQLRDKKALNNRAAGSLEKLRSFL